MRHFRPEVEARIAKVSSFFVSSYDISNSCQYRSENGAVGFGGHLASENDDRLAVPDNLGLRLPASEPADALREAQQV